MKRALPAAALVVGVVAGAWWAGRAGWGPPVGRAMRLAEAPVGGLATPSTLALPELPEGELRHVVLVVADGMGVAQSAAARLRAFGPEGRFLFQRFPVVGLMATHPAAGLVTDSDAGATAFASGAKTSNTRVGTAPDGTPLTSLVELAARAGWVTGVVTSTQVFDATPAAFLAHVDRRRDYDAILEQLLASPVDLLAGGGRERFLPEAAGGLRTDGRDLLAEAASRGTRVVTDLAGLAAADGLPLWAVFPGGVLGEEPAHPDVADLAVRALDLLAAAAEQRGSGLFLVVEEEGIDTGAHHNDLERMTAAALRLDRAVEAIVGFAAGRSDTLVLVLSDHSTGGLSIDNTSDSTTLRVAWTSGRHAGEPVAIYAWGPAAVARRFSGFHDNTRIFDLVAEAAGLAAAPAAGGES